MKIRVNDTVQVMVGKDKGTQAKVTKVIPKKNKVIVEGVNTYKRHMKQRQDVPSGIIEVERAIDISKVMVVSPTSKKPTRIGIQRDKTGEPVRIDKSTGKPLVAKETKKKS